jgi:hypothetical protein
MRYISLSRDIVFSANSILPTATTFFRPSPESEEGVGVASDINVKDRTLCVTGNWPGSRCFAVIEGERPPLWRLAVSLGMDGEATLNEVRAALAHKSWDGQKWIDDSEPTAAGGGPDQLQSDSSKK